MFSAREIPIEIDTSIEYDQDKAFIEQEIIYTDDVDFQHYVFDREYNCNYNDSFYYNCWDRVSVFRIFNKDMNYYIYVYVLYKNADDYYAMNFKLTDIDKLNYIGA